MSRWCILKSKEAIPFITLSVLTNGKPGEVCEIIALHRLKSPSFDSQGENKVALFIFASHSFLAYNHCFKVNLIQSFSD